MISGLLALTLAVATVGVVVSLIMEVRRDRAVARLQRDHDTLEARIWELEGGNEPSTGRHGEN